MKTDTFLIIHTETIRGNFQIGLDPIKNSTGVSHFPPSRDFLKTVSGTSSRNFFTLPIYFYASRNTHVIFVKFFYVPLGVMSLARVLQIVMKRGRVAM